jgi:hypothetical protein
MDRFCFGATSIDDAGYEYLDAEIISMASTLLFPQAITLSMHAHCP